jgi:RHS repeat-associated protein
MQKPMIWTLVVVQMAVTVPLSSAPPAPASRMVPWKDVVSGFPRTPTNPHVVSGLSRTPGDAQVPTRVRPVRTRRITPNRTVPKVDPVPLTPVFSAIPTDQEIFRARVFSEPLVPVMATSAMENQALVDAVTRSHEDRSSGVEPFEKFLSEFPSSAWRPSLLANLGRAYLRDGRPVKALQAWDAAWQATKNDTAPLNRAVADMALGDWLHLTTITGRVGPLAARLAEIGGRDIGGAAVSKVRAAREGLWILQEQHDLANSSGALALNAILLSQAKGTYSMPKALLSFHATPAGTTLSELKALAGRVGLPMKMAARIPNENAPIPIGSVVHFTIDHYSAIVAERNGRYLLRDLIFGGESWATPEALAQESSGYFLIPGDSPAAGWRTVSDAEAAAVIGHCAPGYPDDEDPGHSGTVGGDGENDEPGIGPGDESGNGPGENANESRGDAPPPPDGPACRPTGMPVYAFIPHRASLRLSDVPIGCFPPKGPSTAFRISYDQREAFQPQIFSFWNAGPKWTFDWLSYVVDVPGSGSAKWVYLRGGGREQFGSNPHWRSGASLETISTSPIRYERRLRDGSVEVFAQSDGSTGGQRRVFLTEIIDPQGQSVTFTYDSSLRLVAATDALGQVTLVEYEHPTDPLKVTSVTDPFGRTAEFTYISSGHLTGITDVIGLSSSFAYGPSDFVAAMTTPYGTTVFRHETSPNGTASYRMIEATDPLGGTERVEFHYSHEGLSTSEPSENVPTGFSGHNSYLSLWNSFYWDKRSSSLYPDISKATLYHWLISPSWDPFTYHGASTSLLNSIKRPLENRVWYAYQGQGVGASTHVGTWSEPAKIARVLDDDSSQIWQTTYNALGWPATTTDPIGRQTTYTYATNNIDLLEVRQTGGVNHLLATYSNYTSLHQPQTFVDAAGKTFTYTYNSAGQLLTETNPLSETTTYAYDTDGYLTSVTGAVTGSTRTFTYDDYGRVESVTNSDGYEVIAEYNALDRPTKVTYPDGTFDAIVYDKLDAVEYRDRLGRVTRTFHDALRRVIAVRDPLGRTVTQQWCACGDLEKLIDAKGQTTTWERDLRGRVTREIRADGTTDLHYTYDPADGRLRTMTDPEDQVKTYSYALDDRLLQVTYTNENISTPNLSFTYDANYPRVATMVDGTGTTTYTYKAVGAPGALSVASIDGPLTSDTITFAYDDLGRATSRLVNGFGISARTFDALGRLTKEENELGAFEHTYENLSGRPATTTYPNSQVSTYNYFGNTGDRRLQTIHHQTSGSATLSKFDYTYNAVGGILSWRQQAGSTASMWSYGHDAADQLTTAVKKSTDSTPAIQKRYAYGYDTAGNRSVEQIDDAVMGASHSTLNRLSSQQASGMLRVTGTLNEAGTVTIQGKAASVSSANEFEGNVPIASGTNTFSVVATDTNSNVVNKTYEVSNTGSGKTFTYDANGNLTADGTRTFEWDAENRLLAVVIGTARSEFAYDGLDRRVRIVEKESSTTMRDARFIWIGTTIVEERLSTGEINRFFHDGEEHDGVARYLTRDHLGSIREVLDSSATVITRNEYDPYGRATRTVGTVDSRFAFTGHFQHVESGLALPLYRAFDPALARWISADPIGLEGGLNLYSYVVNEPLSMMDPLGLCPDWLERLQDWQERLLEGLRREHPELEGMEVMQAGVPDARRLAMKAIDIIAKELKGSVHSQFPRQLYNMTRDEIFALAKKGDPFAQTARKLMTQKKYKK